MSAAAITDAPNLRLAATFRCGEHRVVFAQITDRQTGEQTLANFFHGHLPFAIDEGIYNRRHYARRTAGRRSDNKWPRAFSSDAASAQAATIAIARSLPYFSSCARSQTVVALECSLTGLGKTSSFTDKPNLIVASIVKRRVKPFVYGRNIAKTRAGCPTWRETPPYPGLPIGVVSW